MAISACWKPEEPPSKVKCSSAWRHCLDPRRKVKAKATPKQKKATPKKKSKRNPKSGMMAIFKGKEDPPKGTKKRSSAWPRCLNRGKNPSISVKAVEKNRKLWRKPKTRQSVREIHFHLHIYLRNLHLHFKSLFGARKKHD